MHRPLVPETRGFLPSQRHCLASLGCFRDVSTLRRLGLTSVQHFDRQSRGICGNHVVQSVVKKDLNNAENRQLGYNDIKILEQLSADRRCWHRGACGSAKEMMSDGDPTSAGKRPSVAYVLVESCVVRRSVDGEPLEGRIGLLRSSLLK